MISIRKCPICKKEFDAIVGDPVVNCPDCQNFTCDFEIYLRTEGVEIMNEFEESVEIDVPNDVFQEISQIPMLEAKSGSIHNDFVFAKSRK